MTSTTSTSDPGILPTARDTTRARNRALIAALVWAIVFTAMHGY